MEKKGLIVLAGVVFSVSLIAVSATSMFLTDYYSHAHIEALGGICRKMIEKQPEAEQTVLEAIKEYKYGSSVLPEEKYYFKIWIRTVRPLEPIRNA